MENKLLIATTNPGKIKEISEILNPVSLFLVTPQEMGSNLNVQETGDTYSKNAHLKAEAYLQATGLPVLADDSGLEVDVLDGAPGIYSARFSTKPNASDADRRHFLLDQLQGKPVPWSARFFCAAVLALPDGRCFETAGTCTGMIITEERGSTGFGYDPIFLIPEYQATMAELGPEIKNKISHRARALHGMIPILNQIFGAP